MNVSGSFHFIFGLDDKWIANAICADGSENACRVCGMTYDSVEALRGKAPALPGPVEGTGSDDGIVSRDRVKPVLEWTLPQLKPICWSCLRPLCHSGLGRTA